LVWCGPTGPSRRKSHPDRVSQIASGDLESDEVATLSRDAQALGFRLRIIFHYGSERQRVSRASRAGESRDWLL